MAKQPLGSNKYVSWVLYVKFWIHKRDCLLKHFAFLKNVCYQFLKFCAWSNLLFFLKLSQSPFPVSATSCGLAYSQLSRNVFLFSRNLIGQLCLSGPGYSSPTVARWNMHAERYRTTCTFSGSAASLWGLLYSRFFDSWFTKTFDHLDVIIFSYVYFVELSSESRYSWFLSRSTKIDDSYMFCNYDSRIRIHPRFRHKTRQDDLLLETRLWSWIPFQ